MNDLSQLIDELIECAEGILTATKSIVTCGEKMILAAKAVKQIFTKKDEVKALPTSEPELPFAEPPEAKTYTFTDVRKAFSAKAHDGHTEEVKALISKYGAAKLSDIKETDYPALMADLEVIG